MSGPDLDSGGSGTSYIRRLNSHSSSRNKLPNLSHSFSESSSNKVPRILFIFCIFFTILNFIEAAPHELWENDVSEDEGCYYNGMRYTESEQIITNEPCLNCTCHNQMLMCFLKVCPFIKPVGKHCVVEKKPDQCCPTIKCPQVPVGLWTSTALPPLISDESSEGQMSTTALMDSSAMPGHGCTIEGQFYMDGMQVPRDPDQPCELCYCIRNHTACVRQECDLRVPGCDAIYQDGVCCPVKYRCEDNSVLNPGSISPTVRQTTETPSTTTIPSNEVSSSLSPRPTIRPKPSGCTQHGIFYADGSSMETENPCEHCYCIQGKMVCAVESCMGEMDGESDHCDPLPPAAGECCPTEYKCASKDDIPETKPQTKPDIVSTELPFTEETPTTLKPRIKDPLDEDDNFGIQDDDSDDAQPTTVEDEDISMTTVATSVSEETEDTELEEGDKDVSQITPEEVPDTSAQVSSSMKPVEEVSSTEAGIAERPVTTTASIVVEGSGSGDITTVATPEIIIEVVETTEAPTVEEVTANVAPTDCVFVEKTYKDKEQIPSDDPCNLCFCTLGEVVCAIKECPTPTGKENCVALPAAEGECCPREYQCEEATETSTSTVSSSTVDASLAALQQIGPLNGYHHGVSGVVYIIDLKTIRIVGFAYDGLAPDAFFYVGRTLPVSGETGILVPYPGTSASEILLSHDGNQDIILSLPGDITTSEIKWLSVWCRQFEVSFGDVEFPEAVITIEGGPSSSTATTQTSISEDEITDIVTETVSETVTVTTEGSVSLSTEDIKETSTESATPDHTEQPTEIVDVPEVEEGKPTSTSTTVDEIIDTTDGSVESTTKVEILDVDANAQATTQDSVMPTTLGLEEETGSISTESELIEGSAITESDENVPVTVASVDMEDKTETDVLTDGMESSGDGVVTENVIDTVEGVVTTTKDMVTMMTTIRSVDTTSEGVVTTDAQPASTSSVDIVDIPDITTMPDDNEEISTSTDAVVTSLPEIVEQTTDVVETTSSSEQISSTEGITIDQTTTEPQASTVLSVDIVTATEQIVTTSMPVVSEVSSEAVETTISSETSSISTVVPMDDSSASITLQPEISSTDENVVVTTTIPEVAQTSSETVSVTTSDDQLITDDYPEEDLTAETTVPSISEDESEQESSTETASQEDSIDVTATTVKVDTIEPSAKDSIDVPIGTFHRLTRCLLNDTSFDHLENMPSDNICELCQCVNGIRVCAQRDCQPAPSNYKNCQKIEIEGSCCPKFECDEMTTARSEEEEAISTSRQPNEIGVTDIFPAQSEESTSDGSNDIESLPETVEAMTQTTEMTQGGNEDNEEGTDKISMMCILLGNCQPQVRSPDLTTNGTGVAENATIADTTEESTATVLPDVIRIITDTINEIMGNTKNTTIDIAVDSEVEVNETTSAPETIDEILDDDSDDSVPDDTEMPDQTPDTPIVFPDTTPSTFVSIIQIEAYIGIWIRQSDNTVIVCNPTSTASLMCIFQGLAINTTNTYKVDGVTLSKLYNHSLTGSYNGKDTITWTNGEVWGKQDIVRDSDNEIMDDDSDDALLTDACTFDGKVYDNLDRIPNDDPCKLCHCQFGVQICADRDCAVPVGFENCTPLPKPEGKCCSEQFECKAPSSTTESSIETTTVLVSIIPEETVTTTQEPEEQTEIITALCLGEQQKCGFTTSNPPVHHGDCCEELECKYELLGGGGRCTKKEAASETTESSVEATTVLVSIVPEETLTTTQEPEDQNPCCFRYGFGARLVPCCFELISCDEHGELENNGPLVGGAIGKHHFCPTDAAHAHQLVSAVCTLDDVTYQNSDAVPPKNICDESCRCTNGEILCEAKPCPDLTALDVKPGTTCKEVVNEGECCPMFECVADTAETDMEPENLVTTVSPTTSPSQSTESDKVSTIDNIEMEVFGDKEDVTGSSESSSTEKTVTTEIPSVETTTSVGSENVDIDSSSETEGEGTESTLIIIDEAPATTTELTEEGSGENEVDIETTVVSVTEPQETDSTTAVDSQSITSETPVEETIDTTSISPVSEVPSFTDTPTSEDEGTSETISIDGVEEVSEDENEVHTGDTEKPPPALPSINTPDTSADGGDGEQTTLKADATSTDAPATTVDDIDAVDEEEIETSTDKEVPDVIVPEVTTIPTDGAGSSSTIVIEEGSSSSTESDMIDESAATTIASDAQTTTIPSVTDEETASESEMTVIEGSGAITTISTDEVSSSSVSPPIETTDGSSASIPDTETKTTTILPVTNETPIDETTVQVVESSSIAGTDTEESVSETDEGIDISTITPSQPTTMHEEADNEIDPVTTIQPESSTLLAAKTSCILDGVAYNNFDPMPSSDPCELCFCQYGAPVCATEECPKPKDMENCYPVDPPAGECCSVEYHCPDDTTEVVTEVAPETTTSFDVVVDESGDNIAEETEPLETTKQPSSEESASSTVAPTEDEVAATTASATDVSDGIEDVEGTTQGQQSEEGIVVTEVVVESEATTTEKITTVSTDDVSSTTISVVEGEVEGEEEIKTTTTIPITTIQTSSEVVSETDVEEEHSDDEEGDDVSTTLKPMAETTTSPLPTETSTEDQQDITISNFIDDTDPTATSTKSPEIVVISTTVQDYIETTAQPEESSSETVSIGTEDISSTLAPIDISTTDMQGTTISNFIDDNEPTISVTVLPDAGESSTSIDEDLGGTTVLQESSSTTSSLTESDAVGDETTLKPIDSTTSGIADTTISNFIEEEDLNVITTKLPDAMEDSSSTTGAEVQSTEIPEAISPTTLAIEAIVAEDDEASTTLEPEGTPTTENQETTISNFIDDTDPNLTTTEVPAIIQSTSVLTEDADIEGVSTQMPVRDTTVLIADESSETSTALGITEPSTTDTQEAVGTTGGTLEESASEQETTSAPEVVIDGSGTDVSEEPEQTETTQQPLSEESGSSTETATETDVVVDGSGDTTEIVTEVAPETTTSFDVVVDGSGDNTSEQTKPSETTKQPSSEESASSTLAPTEDEVAATTASAIEVSDGIEDVEGTTQGEQPAEEIAVTEVVVESETTTTEKITTVSTDDVSSTTILVVDGEVEGEEETKTTTAIPTTTTQTSSEVLSETEIEEDHSDAEEGDDVMTTLKPLVHHTTTQSVAEMDGDHTSTESESIFTTIINTIITTIAPEIFTTTTPVSTETESSAPEATTSSKVEIDGSGEGITEDTEIVDTTQLPVSEESTSPDDITEQPTTIIVPQEVTEQVTTSTESDTTTQAAKYCIESGMIIQSGKIVPSADPCKRCICESGDVLCSTRECPPKPEGDCSPLPLEGGQCCPKYACIDNDQIRDDDPEDTSGTRIRPDGPTSAQNETVESVTAPTYPPSFPEASNITTSEPVESISSTTISTTTSTETTPTTSVVTTSSITSTTETSSIDSISDEDEIFGTASSDVETTTSVDEYIPDYPYYPDEGQLTLDDLDKIGPGACLFDGKVYVSAQQIPRENPCDFCFCFRGDIICLQQSCPPPIPGCREEIIGGFCCPRYECPVKMATHNITVPAPVTPPSLSSFLFGGSSNQDPPEEIQQQISGCEVNGNFYETGAIVEESSSPCLQCRCGYDEKLECEPQPCEPQPMMQKMLAIRR